MFKKLIKKHLPTREMIVAHKSMRRFAHKLHLESLWQIDAISLPRAVATGLFCALLPMPFQMVVAASIAIPIQANLPISLALVWLTNPVTMPAVFYFCYRIGVYLTGISPTATGTMSLAWIYSEFPRIWIPLLTGSLVCAIISACAGYWLTKAIWHYLAKH